MPTLPRPALRSTVRRALRAALAAALLAAPAACGEEGSLLAPLVGLGRLEGEWDGKAWAGYGYAVLDGDTLRLIGHRPDPEFYYDEFVRASVAFRGAGTYPVGVRNASLEQITGGDAGYFPGAEGELRVTDYDAAAGRVRGTLRLTAAEHGFRWRFEGGSFDAPVYARWEDVPRVRGR